MSEDKVENGSFRILYDLLEEEFNGVVKANGIKTTTLAKVITNDERSVDFINQVLNKNKLAGIDRNVVVAAYNDDPEYSVVKTRARHSLITFLMGLVFSKFNRFNKKIDCELDDKHISDWLIISLYHDFGYYSSYLRQIDKQLREISAVLSEG